MSTVATRAVRASVNSVLVVGLFDGFATGLSYAVVGVPRAAVWGAIIGPIAAVPFLSAMRPSPRWRWRMAIEGQASAGARRSGGRLDGAAWRRQGGTAVWWRAAGIHLPFVWDPQRIPPETGGFEALGLVGLVVGPVVLALAKVSCGINVRGDLDRAQAGSSPQTQVHSNESLSCTTPVLDLDDIAKRADLRPLGRSGPRPTRAAAKSLGPRGRGRSWCAPMRRR